MQRIQTSILNFFRNRKVFWFLFFFYFIGFILEMLYRNFFFELTVHDLGYQAQPIFNLLFNGKYYNSFEGMHPIANHFRPGLLVFLPFIKLIATPIWLLFFKIVAYMSCPLILLKYGKKYFVIEKYAYTLPILWLLNDIVSRTLNFQNVSTGIILPFIMLAFFMAYENRHKSMYLLLILVLFFKESMALVWLSVGAFKFVISKQYRHGIFLFISGMIIGIFVHFGLMPMFNAGNLSNHHRLFAPFSYIPLKIIMFIKVFLSTGLILLVRPLVLLFVLPAFGLYVVGAKLGFFYISAHHHDFTITITFVGMFFVLKSYLEGSTWLNNLKLSKQKIMVTTALFLLMVVGFSTGMPYLSLLRPIYKNGSYAEQFKLSREAIQIFDKIDKGITVYSCKGTGSYLLKHPDVRHLQYSTLELFSEKNAVSFYVVYPKNRKYMGIDSQLFSLINNKVQEGLNNGSCVDLNLFEYFNIYLINKKTIDS